MPVITRAQRAARAASNPPEPMPERIAVPLQANDGSPPRIPHGDVPPGEPDRNIHGPQRGPQQRWLRQPTTTMQPEQVNLAQGAAHRIQDQLEKNLGLTNPSLDHGWEDASEYPGLAEEVIRNWNPLGALRTQITISPGHHVICALYILPVGAEIRYITPQNVWAHTLSHQGTELVTVEPEPTPLNSLPIFAGALKRAPTASCQVEFRFQMQELLTRAAGLQDRHAFAISEGKSFASNRPTLNSATARYRFKTINSAPTCPGCQRKSDSDDGPCTSLLEVHIDKYFHNAHVKCLRAGKTKPPIRIPDTLYSYLFNSLPAPPDRSGAHWERPAEGIEDPDEPLGPVAAPTPLAQEEAREEGVPAPHSLNIVSYNSDGGLRHRAAELIGYLRDINADVVLLQETESLGWSNAALLDNGWVLHRHKKCAIMVRVGTADKVICKTQVGDTENTKVWKSSHYNSMAISLDTTSGPLLIVNAYLPHGVDRMAQEHGHPDRAAVRAQHQEILRLTSRYKHSVLCMDANETTHNKARIQSRHDGTTTYSGTKAAPGLEGSCMAPYDKTLVDAFRHKAIHDGRDPTDYPNPSDTTHSQPGKKDAGILRIQSKIDYILTSHNLLPRIISCTIDNRPIHWTEPGKIRTNYHSALCISLDWEDLWPSDEAGQGKQTAKGNTLAAPPNYSAMTPGRKAAIARRVHQILRERWPRLRGIWRKSGKKKNEKTAQRDMLMNIFKSVILSVAKSILGVRKPSQAADTDDLLEVSAQWDELEGLVGKALGITIESYGPGGKPSLEHDRIEEIRALFAPRDIHLPRIRADWIEWWHRRDYHRAQATMARESLILTDHMAVHSPKRFYTQATKPLTSSHISALRRDGRVITTDEGIEDELHSYLERMADAGPDIPPVDSPRERRPRKRKRGTVRPTTLGLMSHIADAELRRTIQSLDDNSGPGFEGISPALLKAVTLGTWQEKIHKTDADKEKDALYHRFSDFCINEYAELPEEDRPPPLPKCLLPTDVIEHTTIKVYEPHLTMSLLRRILNLCLETGDIPSVEKLGIITGLPKSDGLVNDTDDLRPITVGPAINRLLHKVLADRLSAAIVKYKLIDEAQFAFLPGGDIHEPISAVTTCYRNHNSHGGGCYTIYYDISKAYDTIRWSSIESAMRDIGLDTSFVTFVLSVLEGTKVAMRTNVSGRTTRTVQLHKSIKQGCPLAPLLFIIVMDELHRKLRASKLGYTLKNGMQIGSRGYCDDTFIAANTTEDLKQMNRDVIHPFFAKHGLLINEKKTKVTGRNPDGSPYTDRICWPGSGKPFETVCPTKPVRYLGLHVTLDLDWKPQVNKLQALVHSTVAHLDSGRLTLLQGLSITKYVTGPKMEIGMRHASIPREKLRKWDQMLSRSLCKRAGVTDGSIHLSGTAVALKFTPLEDIYDTVKLAYAAELLTRDSELRPLYEATLASPLAQIDDYMKDTDHIPHPGELKNMCDTKPWPSMLTALLAAASKGLWISHNINSRNYERDPTKGSKGTGHYAKSSLFKGARIPTRDTHDLWGASFDKLFALRDLLRALQSDQIADDIRELSTRKCFRTARTYHCPGCPKAGGPNHSECTLSEAMTDKLSRSTCAGCGPLWPALDAIASRHVHAHICTDGSTYQDRPSAAALIFLEDGAHTKELWGVPGYGWQITVENNYVAEMAAIHKAIRSVPVGVNLTIHTDSQSSIDSIETAVRCPTGLNLLRKGARPYLLSIVRAWKARTKAGGTTTLRHVRAHTGGRDLASIGNACADRLAKWAALQPIEPIETRSCLDLMQGDHPYVLKVMGPTDPLGSTATPHEMECKTEAVHGDIRRACKRQLSLLLRHTLARRERRGELQREHPTNMQKAIDMVHDELRCSSGLSLALQSVTQNVVKVKVNDNYIHKSCERCGTGAALTMEHRLHDCPCNEATANLLDDLIAGHTGIEPDVENAGPSLPPLIPQLNGYSRAITSILTSGPGPPEAVARSPEIYFHHPQHRGGVRASAYTRPGSLRNYALMLTLTAGKDTPAEPPAPPPGGPSPPPQPRTQSETPVPRRAPAHKRPLEDAGATRSEDLRTNKCRTLHDTWPGRPRITLTLKSPETHLEEIQAYHNHLRRQGLASTRANLEKAAAETNPNHPREGATHKRPLENARENLRDNPPPQPRTQVGIPVPRRIPAYKRPLEDAGAARPEDMQTNKRRNIHETRPGRPRITVTLKSPEAHLKEIQTYRNHLRRQGLASTRANLDKAAAETTHKQSRERVTHKRPLEEAGDNLGENTQTKKRGLKCSSNSCVRCRGQKAEVDHDHNNLCCAELEMIERRKQPQIAPPPPRHDAQTNRSRPASPPPKPIQEPREDNPTRPLNPASQRNCHRQKLAKCLRHIRKKYGGLTKAPAVIQSKLAEHARRCGTRIRHYDNSPDVTFEGTPLAGNEQVVRSHLRLLFGELTDQKPRHRAPVLRQICRLVLRTYCDLYYNLLTAQAPWMDCWFGRHPGGALVGATKADSAAAFMRNRYTWVDMRHSLADQHADLACANEAVSNSDHPARVALLLRDSEATRQLMATRTPNTRKYILVEIPEDSGPILTKEDYKLLDLEDRPSLHTTTEPLMLAVIENNAAPLYSSSHLTDLLSAIPGTKVIAQPHHTQSGPDTINELKLDLLCPRYHPLLRKSQFWYLPRNYHPTHARHDNDEKKTEGKKGSTCKQQSNHPHRILLLMGILPPGYKHRLSAYWETNIGDGTTSAISKIIRNTSLALLMKDETLRKWKRRGNAWRS